jgi:hypothetical protein
MKIRIEPVSIFTPTGTKQAAWFEVRYTNYTPGNGAISDCHLWTAEVEAVEQTEVVDAVEGVPSYEIAASVISSTQEQCDQWTDDILFFQSIATNAGLTPVIV